MKALFVLSIVANVASIIASVLTIWGAAAP
jgi:hypothetical protein